MNDDATINENGGKYAGMDRYEAREAIVQDLEDQGYLVKVEEYTQRWCMNGAITQLSH